MTLDEIVSDVRQEANCPSSGGSVTDSEIARYVNRAKDLICQKIIKADVKYFEQDELLSFVAAQAEYDIPRIFKDGKISLVERLASDGTVQGTLDYVSFQDKEEWTVQEHPHTASPWVYYLRERKIGFRPIPQATESSAIRVYGPQFPHDLIWFKAQSVSGATFVIPLSSDATNMKAGRVKYEADYYKNAVFMAVSGSGIGNTGLCTGYAPTTRTVTLSAAITGVASNDELVLLSKIPEEYHDALVQFAVARVAKKKPDKVVYELAAANFRDLVESMVSSIHPRHIDKPDVIPYPEDDWELP